MIREGKSNSFENAKSKFIINRNLSWIQKTKSEML